MIPTTSYDGWPFQHDMPLSQEQRLPLRLDPGVNPDDRQARHCAINDESDVSSRVGRAEVDGMSPLGQSYGMAAAIVVRLAAFMNRLLRSQERKVRRP